MSYEKNKIRLVFIGTPDFGIPSFTALMNDQLFEIILVVTQPDMPIGRKQIITSPPIKSVALTYGIEIAQPKKIIEISEKIKLLKPDAMVVIAYAQLIPEEIINIPKYGCFNLHASLLPKYRGAAVIQAAILNGDKETGVTVIKIDKGLDTGPILAQSAILIAEKDNAAVLYDKLAILGAELLIETIKNYIAGKIIPQKQDETKASYVGLLKKADGLINWAKPAQDLERFIRAMTPWPSAWAWWQGKQIKITSVQNQIIEINTYKPGKTFIYNSGLAVQCGKDALIIRKLQLEGKKEVAIEEFLRGHKDFIGNILA